MSILSLGSRWPTRFALILLLVPATFADTPLQWKLSAGESLSYQFVQSTQTETAGTGKPMRIAIDTAMTVTWKVESVDANQQFIITQTIDKFSATVKVDKLDPIVYDSTAMQPPAGPAREIADAVGKLIGVPCRIHMTQRGEITAAESSEALQQALGSASKAGAGASQSAESISAILRQAAIILPEESVAPGATWEVQQELKTPSGPILQRNQFTYEGPAEHGEAKHEKLTLQSTFALAPAANKTSPLKIKEGQQTGLVWFDSTTGRVVSTELSQKLVTERPYRDTAIQVQSTSNVMMKLVRS